MAIETGSWMGTRREDSSQKKMILFLDGVRAFACLIVIWFHMYQIPRDLDLWNPAPSVHALLNSFLYFGKYGVTLFFVLSGFLLFLPFAKALLFENNWPSIRRFYLRRVFRIVPAYYLSLILLVLLLRREYLQPQHWQDMLLFFTFLMDSSQATFKQLNAPFWTLAIEWQFYMLLPLLVLGMRLIVRKVKPSARLFATIVCLLIVIAWGLFSRYAGMYFQQHPTATVLVSREILNGILFLTYGVSGKYLEDFGVGMLLSLCFVYGQHLPISSKGRILLQRLSPWLWGTGLLCLLVMILWSYNQKFINTWPLFNASIFLSSGYVVNELCISLSFGFCILALLFGSTWLRRPFEWSPLRWIGTISYSLYMWHLPFLLVFLQWIQPSLMKDWSPEPAYGIYWLWMLVVVIPFCFLFFRWVEKPGIKLGERLMRRKVAVASSEARPSASVAQKPIAQEGPQERLHYEK